MLIIAMFTKSRFCQEDSWCIYTWKSKKGTSTEGCHCKQFWEKGTLGAVRSPREEQLQEKKRLERWKVLPLQLEPEPLGRGCLVTTGTIEKPRLSQRQEHCLLLLALGFWSPLHLSEGCSGLGSTKAWKGQVVRDSLMVTLKRAGTAGYIEDTPNICQRSHAVDQGSHICWLIKAPSTWKSYRAQCEIGLGNVQGKQIGKHPSLFCFFLSLSGVDKHIKVQKVAFSRFVDHRIHAEAKSKCPIISPVEIPSHSWWNVKTVECVHS